MRPSSTYIPSYNTKLGGFSDQAVLTTLSQRPIDDDESFVLMVEEVGKIVDKTTLLRILEVGCGSGHLGRNILRSHGEYIQTYVWSDISKEAVDLLRLPNNTGVAVYKCVVDVTDINCLRRMIDKYNVNLLIAHGCVRYFHDGISGVCEFLCRNGVSFIISDFAPFPGGRCYEKTFKVRSFSHWYRKIEEARQLDDTKDGGGEVDLMELLMQVPRTSRSVWVMRSIHIGENKRVRRWMEWDVGKKSCIFFFVGLFLVALVTAQR